MGFIIVAVIFFWPIMSFIFMIVHLIDFLRAPKGSEERVEEKKSLISTSILFCVLVALIIGLIVAMDNAVMNM